MTNHIINFPEGMRGTDEDHANVSTKIVERLRRKEYDSFFEKGWKFIGNMLPEDVVSFIREYNGSSEFYVGEKAFWEIGDEADELVSLLSRPKTLTI